MSANRKIGHQCYTCFMHNQGYCMVKGIQLTRRERNCKYYKYGYYDKYDKELLNEMRRKYNRENNPFS